MRSRNLILAFVVLALVSLLASTMKKESTPLLGVWSSQDLAFEFLDDSHGKLYNKRLNFVRFFEYQLDSNSRLEIELYGTDLFSGEFSTDVSFLNDDCLSMKDLGDSGATFARDLTPPQLKPGGIRGDLRTSGCWGKTHITEGVEGSLPDFQVD